MCTTTANTSECKKTSHSNTHITPFPADPICSECGANGIISSAAGHYWQWMIHFAANMLATLSYFLRFPPKLPLPVAGSVPVSHMVPMATRVITLNSILISSAGFVWVPNDMLYNALSRGRKAPKLPLHLGSCHPAGQGPSHSHRQHAQKNWLRSHMWFQKYRRG